MTPSPEYRLLRAMSALKFQRKHRTPLWRGSLLALALVPALCEALCLPTQGHETAGKEAPAVEADQYADIRERIKARAAELDLKATKPKEVFEATEQKNVLQSMVDTAVEETQKEEEALAYSDGLGVVEGMKKELDLIIWPGPQEVLNTLGLVVVITAVMVIYVLGVDKFLQFALDPLFHYPAKEVIAEKAAKAAAQAASAAAAGAGL